MACCWVGLFSYELSAGSSCSLVLTVTLSVWLVYRPHYESVLADYFIRSHFFPDRLVTSSFLWWASSIVMNIWFRCYDSSQTVILQHWLFLCVFEYLLIDWIHAKLLPPVSNCQSFFSSSCDMIQQGHLVQRWDHEFFIFI